MDAGSLPEPGSRTQAKESYHIISHLSNPIWNRSRKIFKIFVSGGKTDTGGRIAQQFRNSLQSLGGFGEDLIVFFVGNLPVLLVWAAVIAGVFFGGRKIWRRVKAKRTGDSDN